jgi:tetratricopeptide (TPR) repeat protein
MSERTYMGIDGRRDHSFRIPRPDLAETGSPDACTDCHADRDPAWASEAIAGWYPDSERRGEHFATAFAAARWEPAAQADALLALAAQPDAAGIVRATALDLLAPVADAGIADQAAPLLADPDPLVRGAAATLQRALAPEPRVERLGPVLRDPLRAVRIAAAKAMLDAPTTGAGTDSGAALRGAMAEWRAALLTRGDFPETHMQVGGAALSLRDLQAAERAFGEAADLDPQMVDAWAMIARIHAAGGDLEGAARALDAGLAANPSDPGLAAMRAEVEAAR